MVSNESQSKYTQENLGTDFTMEIFHAELHLWQ